MFLTRVARLDYIEFQRTMIFLTFSAEWFYSNLKSSIMGVRISVANRGAPDWEFSVRPDRTLLLTVSDDRLISVDH